MDPSWNAKAGRLWKRHKRIVWAFVAGGAAAGVFAGLGALAVVEFGLYDIAAAQQHNKIVSWALHKTFEKSVRLRAGPGSSPPFTRAQVVSGFKQYQADCMMCHGGPGVSRAEWVKGLEPTPPFLLESGNQWTPAQLTYIVDKGIKMSAMPSWGETRSKDQIRDIVAFLVTLPRISPAEFANMQRQFPPEAASEGPTEAQQVH